MDVQDIIEIYRNADEEKRMSLFLEFRDLRAAFSAIDEEQKQS